MPAKGRKPKGTHIPGLLIDDEDRWLIEERTWRVHRKGYVVCIKYAGYEKAKFFQLHREVLKPPPGAIVDHINGNKLDNRKCNLRIVTQSENMQNLRKKNQPKSGYRGVQEVNGRFMARVCVRGKVINGGWYATAEEAAEVAEGMRRQYFPAYTLENREYGT